MIDDNRGHKKYTEFVQQLIRSYDSNGNGKIPLNEFVNILSDLCQYWGVTQPQGAELQALIEYLGIREDSTYLSPDAIGNLAQIIEKSQEGTNSQSLQSKLGLPNDGHGPMSNNHSNMHGGFGSNNSKRHKDLGHSPMRQMHETRKNQNHGTYGRNQHNMNDPSNKLFDHDFGNLNHSGMGMEMGGDMHNRSGMGMGMGGDMHNRSGMGMGMGGDMHNRSGMGMGMGGDMHNPNQGLNNQNSQMVEDYVRVLFTTHDTDHDGQILKCILLSLKKNRRIPRHRFGTGPGAESTIPRLYHNSIA
jgi:hypothetical protein